MKKYLIMLALIATSIIAQAKTLVVYYSFTNNVHTIVNELRTQIQVDVIRVQPAEKGLDYAANNYAIGSAQIQAIRDNPNNASSYPEIDPVEVNLADYDMIIVAAPLWWSNMAAPLQTFLFNYGSQMAGKNIGLIVSSASSGISGVEADAKRLIPNGIFVSPSLWIRSAQTTDSRTMIEDWLRQIDYNNLTAGIDSVTSDNKTGLHFSNDTLRVDGDFESLTIYNLSGDKVLESTANITYTSELTPGVYVARINSGVSSTSKTISIIR